MALTKQAAGLRPGAGRADGGALPVESSSGIAPEALKEAPESPDLVSSARSSAGPASGFQTGGLPPSEPVTATKAVQDKGVEELEKEGPLEVEEEAGEDVEEAGEDVESKGVDERETSAEAKKKQLFDEVVSKVTNYPLNKDVNGIVSKVEEEQWRHRFWKSFDEGDRRRRKAAQMALYSLRNLASWRCASLEEKIKMNLAEIARVPRGCASIDPRSRAEGSSIDDMSSSATPRPRKRKYVRMVTSPWSQSTATPDTLGTGTRQSASAAWVQSLETTPLESGLVDSEECLKKRKKCATGVIRDFSKPFHFQYALKEKSSVAAIDLTSTE